MLSLNLLLQVPTMLGYSRDAQQQVYCTLTFTHFSQSQLKSFQQASNIEYSVVQMGQSRNPCKWTVSVPGWTTVWRSDTRKKGGPVCWCRFDKRVHEKAGKEADSSVVHFHDCAPLKIFSFKSSMGAYFCFFHIP